MVKRRVMFDYPKEAISEPVIYTFSRDFNLTTNIGQTNITGAKGWVILEIEGREEDIEAGISWVTSRGIIVKQA